tara:strand:- start:22685 stop:23350 length:666 start_codon:yes stop_codon:yes gene_type:complete
MEIDDAHKLFNLWIDKTASPYFTDDEIDLFLNRAIVEFVNDHFDTKPVHRAEASIRDVEELRELIEIVDDVRTDSNGKIKDTEINESLTGAGATDREFSYILSASKASSKECGGEQRKSRFVRHNDWLAQKDNTYKKPTEEYPTHRLFNGYIQFNPATESNVEFVVLKKHLEVSKASTDSKIELSDKAANKIIFMALRQAGVSLREEDFYGMATNEINENE